jgi:hypothetical protein
VIESFPVLDVSAWRVDLLEPEGSDEKIWLIDPVTGGRALFKPNVRNDDPERADHWPEKLASELAGRLGLPRAKVDLAIREDRRGCLSYDVAPHGWALQPGYVLLEALLGQHDPMNPAGHSLENVRTVLTGYACPPGFFGPTGSTDLDALDVFVGYLVFDAVIANRDRHPANWAVLLGPVEGEQALAPSFDHATSLGFNLSDDERERRLGDPRDWEAFLRKGTAHRFEGCRKLPLTDFARQAMTLVRPDIGKYWLDQLAALSTDRIRDLTSAIPEMSESARRFAVALIEANRGRLLDG